MTSRTEYVADAREGGTEVRGQVVKDPLPEDQVDDLWRDTELVR